MGKLKDIATRAPKEWDKEETKKKTARLVEELDELQNLLYASGSHALLVILQGLDASGKNGVVNNIFGHLDPHGVAVYSFKVPTEEELSHDFLWRVHKQAPAKGSIGLFNRSHYEDVLVTRVHGWCNDETAKRRFRAINDFERLLQEHNNTIILKFYLHISPEEQKERFEERLEDPRKRWKYNPNDEKEAGHWARYMDVYEEVFENCNDVPWHIIPSDQNWYKEHLIAAQTVEALKALNLKYPQLADSIDGKTAKV